MNQKSSQVMLTPKPWTCSVGLWVRQTCMHMDGTSLPWMVDLRGIDSVLSFDVFAYQPPASTLHLGKKSRVQRSMYSVAASLDVTTCCTGGSFLFHGILLTWLHICQLDPLGKHFMLIETFQKLYPFSLLSNMSSISGESIVNPLQSTVDEIVTELFNLLSTGQVSWFNLNLGQLIQQNVFQCGWIWIWVRTISPWS